jgi:uncharacterized protein
MTTMTNTPATKPPLPPFTRETAIQKIRMAEDAWNSQDPDRVKMAYTENSVWRNRSTFVTGRDEIRQLLVAKWQREQDYRLIKELWAYTDNRIAVRFCYEYSMPAASKEESKNNNDDNDNITKEWFRAYGNENWEFDENGLMAFRHASINDVAIKEADRKFHWTTGSSRPLEHPGLTELGL